MAKITQVGPGRKTSGTIDGVTYVTTRKGNGIAINRFTHLNYKAFAAALDALADRMVAGEVVTRSGYGKVYLTGAWPDTITLRASGGDSTIIVIVAENGQTTTITPAEGGSTTVISGGGGSGSGSGVQGED